MLAEEGKKRRGLGGPQIFGGASAKVESAGQGVLLLGTSVAVLRFLLGYPAEIPRNDRVLGFRNHVRLVKVSWVRIT